MGESNKKSLESSTSRFKEIIALQTVLASATFDLESFMELLVERVQILTHATGAVIELIENDEMVYRAASGTVSQYVGLRLKISGSLSGYCVRTGEIAISEDTSKDPRVDAAACKKVNAASMIVVPLFRKSEIVGVLKVLSDKIKSFDNEGIETLQLLAGLLGGALGQQVEINQRQKLEEQLQHMAQYDNLTGLPNRALCQDRLSHALERSKRNSSILALFYIDIDRFKSINDTYGHQGGDTVLKQFSERISSVIRASDTFARLGGDEFLLIAESLENLEQPKNIANKILKCLNPGIAVQQTKITVTISIGIAVNTDKNVPSMDLVQQADTELYKAKKLGGNCFSFEQTS